EHARELLALVAAERTGEVALEQTVHEVLGGAGLDRVVEHPEERGERAPHRRLPQQVVPGQQLLEDLAAGPLRGEDLLPQVQIDRSQVLPVLEEVAREL